MMDLDNNVSRETKYSNAHIIDAVKSDVLQGKAVHAYMFEGGTQKARMELALLTSMFLICENCINSVDSFESAMQHSENCPACAKILNSNHPDVLVMGNKLTESGMISVEVARDIKKQALWLPNEAQKRVFIINNAHKLNNSAQNALLKIFEEPPKDVVFILLCNCKKAFLPTTLSRMIIYRLNGNVRQEILREAAVKYKLDVNSDSTVAVAGYIEAFGDAQLGNDDIKNVLNSYNLCKELFLTQDKVRLVEKLPKDRESLLIALKVIILCCRDIMCIKNGVKDMLILPDTDVWQQCAGKYSAVKLMSLYDKLTLACQRLEKYANLNTVLGVLSHIVQ